MHSLYAQGGDTLFCEDFSNGLAGNNSIGAWTISDNGGNSIWMMSDEESPAGDYSSPWQPLASPTASNGWIIFDADRYNSTLEGDPISVGGYLYAPEMNFENDSNIRLIFYQSYAYCCEQTSPLTIEVSVDNGEGWAVWELGKDYPIGAYEPSKNPEKKSIDISCAAAGHSSVLLRWGFNGLLNPNYTNFFWGLDDICIVSEDPFYDIEIIHGSLSDLNEIMEYSMFHHESGLIDLGLKFRNAGNQEITDVTWMCELLDEDMDLLESMTSEPFTIPSNSNSENCTSDSIYYQTIHTTWGFIDEEANYFVRYSIIHDQMDATPENNIFIRPVKISDWQWGHTTWWESDTIVHLTPDVIGTPHLHTLYGMGTVFESLNGQGICAIWVHIPYLVEMTFLTASVELDESYDLDLGNWVSNDEYYLTNNSMSIGDSLFYLPFGDVANGSEGPVLVLMEIEESHDDPLPIAAKSHSNWDNSTWQIRRSGNNGWSIFRGGGWTPAIAADFTPCVSVFENEANSLIQNLTLSPLPADDIVHVHFDLDESEVAAYVVRDVNGKRINYKNLGRLPRGPVAFDVDVSELASGTYVLTIALSNGAHVERKIVVH